MPYPQIIALLLCLLSINTYAQTTCPTTTNAGITVYNIKSFPVPDPNSPLDHTQAFLNAIECGKINKIAVYVPRGNYIVNQPLVLEDQSLIGELVGTVGGDGSEMESFSTITFDTGLASDAIVLNGASSIKGLTLRFGDGSQLPANQISSISVRGIGVSVSDIKIYAPYCGICSSPAADGKHNVGRLEVDNVFMVAPQFGVKIGVTLDVSRLTGIHLWENGTTKPGSVGFWFKKNDFMTTSNLSVYNMATGFKFDDNVSPLPLESGGSIENGGSIISMSGTVVDFCHEGFDISGNAKVSITGGTIYNHFTGIKVAGNAQVQVSGAQILSNGAPAITVGENASVTMSGNHVRRDLVDNGHHAILVNGANTLTVTGNTFVAAGHGVYFQTPVQKAANVSVNTFDLTANPNARAIWSSAGTNLSNLVSIGNSSTNN